MTETIKKPKMKTIKQRTKQDKIFFWTCLAYPIIHFAIFYVYINADSFVLAFQTYDKVTKTYNFSKPLQHFERFFREFWGANNLVLPGLFLSFLSYCIGFFIGTPLTLYYSYVLYKKIPAYKFFKVILYAPAVVSTTVWVLLYKQTVGAMIPAISEAITGVPMEGLLDNRATALPTLLFHGLWTGPGTGTLIYVATMAGIPEEQSEAMRIDGAGAITEFWHLTMPSIWPTFGLFLYMGAGGMFLGDLGLYTFYGESSPDYLQPFGYLVARLTYRAASNVFDLPYIAAIAYFQTLISIPLIFIAKAIVTRVGPKTEG